MPKPLDFDRLKQFEQPPSSKAVSEPVVDTAGAYTTRWPSREPVSDSQISIKAPLVSLDRFKRICKEDRRTYADMLGILMDLYEKK
jgi:hypothetical protein